MDHQPGSVWSGGPARSVAAVIVAGVGSAAVFTVVGSSLPPRVDLRLVVFVVTFGVILAVAGGYSLAIDRVWSQTRREAELAVAGYKSEFVARLSHELRTSLTGIVGFAQMIDPAVLGGDNAEAMKTVIGQSVELSRVVDDLSATARLDAGEPSRSPVRVSIREAVDSAVTFTSLEGVIVGVSCDDADVLADPESLRHILRNLLGNAHRHGLPPIEVRGQQYGSRYVCQVVDHGPGFIDERSPLGSTGLGLRVAARLASEMGAELTHRRIRAETHFILTIPLVPVRPESRAGIEILRNAIGRLHEKEGSERVEAT